MASENVEIVDSFVYLGSLMDRRGGNDLEIRCRIEITRSCMAARYAYLEITNPT